MCELIFCSLRSPQLDRLAVHLLAHKGSSINNDGFGVFSPNGGLFKTAIAAENLLDIGAILKDFIPDSKPVMAHVRWASPGIDIKDENAHPFDNKGRFVLAHNGRLYSKDEEVTRAASQNNQDTSIGSDSEKFLKKLDEYGEKNPDKTVVEIVNAVMEEFKGKFAFLIYDRMTSKFYAIRGKTADLYITYMYAGYPPEKDKPIEGAKVGYMIMTKEADLAEASYLTCTLIGTVYNKQVFTTKPVSLKEETAYALEASGAVEVGTVKENPTYTQTSNVAVWNYGRYGTPRNGSSPSTDKIQDEYLKLTNRVAQFMEEHFLDIPTIDEIFVQLFGTGIADANLKTLQVFTDNYIPQMSASKRTRKKLEDAGVVLFPHYSLLKVVDGLKFPWMMSDPKVIEKAIVVLKAAK